MTTTVTVETHGFPVQVSTFQQHSFTSDTRLDQGSRHSTDFVPRNEKRSFTVSADTTVTVTELPADATALPHAQFAKSAACGAADSGPTLDAHAA